MARFVLVTSLVLLLWSEYTHAQVAAIAILDTEHLRKGVVRITAAPPGQNQKVGTGFIVRLEKDLAYIVTAAHVVSGDAQPMVQFFPQEDVSVQATVKHSEGGDEVTGLALLVVRGKNNLPSGLTVLTLASTSRLSGNEEIVVIGHPRGAGDWAILKGGIASRQGRYMTIDANIDEGNSGGPIIHSGEVVGLIGGVTRYGRGVTAGSVREYLEGHGIDTRAAPPAAVARVQPIPSIPIKPEKSHPAFDREITGKDGAPMVLIPAGEFWMGSPDSEGNKDEHPRHKVYLDAYYIDKFEVTVSLYSKFLQSTAQRDPDYWNQVKTSTHGNLPVVGVHYNDAWSYCRWAEKRLPTEAEWEKAARGTDERRYPWGNEQPSPRLANFVKEYSDNPYDESLVSVDSNEAGKSPYGLHHMAGNVWEWTADWYGPDFYAQSPQRNPTGPSDSNFRVVRGGIWELAPHDVLWSDDPIDVRSAGRSLRLSIERKFLLGLRCAQDSPK